MFKSMLRLAVLLFLVGPGRPASAQVDARMLRFPDVSQDRITFVYAGDIWVVPKTGGTAFRLSSPAGEESFPRFSPDGQSIAFSGNYNGNTDIYVVPAMGGIPRRLTYHPMEDRLLDWYPDGKHVLYASSMESGKQRFNQLYKKSTDGSLPEKLPVAYGEFGTLSPDGKQLAYMTMSQDFRTWKRYRGGWSPDIWLFDLASYESKNITSNSANDSQPMWAGNTIYFISDRDAGQRNNLWAYDVTSGTARQITKFTDFDIRFPAIGPSDIVFEAGGRLYLMDLKTEKYDEVRINVVTDRASLQPRVVNVSDLIQTAGISPSGKRAVFEARGDVFTVPAENGPVYNLTHTPGVAERFPSWSPDGKWVAYFSDRSGEYELSLRAADGSGGEQQLTKLGAGFRYRPIWSPDSKKIAFIDQSMTVSMYDVDAKKTSKIDKQLWRYHGDLQGFRVSWSADSRWIAYEDDLPQRQTRIVLYDTKNGQKQAVTSGYYNDSSPAFDPEGKYLYFLTNRTFDPIYSDVDNSWIYPNSTNIAVVPLRKDVPSPLAPKNDEESVEQKKEDQAGEETKDKSSEQDKKESEEKIKPVDIDLAGMEERLVLLPARAGNYGWLQAVKGKVLYQRFPRAGSADEKTALVFFDLEEREEQLVLDDVNGFIVSATGEKVLVSNQGKWGIIDIKPGQKVEKPLRTAEMEMIVDPMAEYRQIFTDAWRFERDFFYDPNMHGVDWTAMKTRYSRLIDDAVTRWDVDFVLGELIAELNASHTYRGGGDQEQAPYREVGLLGVDWALENGAYRIKRIIDGGPWDSEVRSPLREPGVNVSVGDFVLAVNGVPLDPSLEPWAVFQGLANQTVRLTVNSKPSRDGARDVLVKTLADETRLRHLAWIEQNRKYVEERSGGRVGYVFVPSTGINGQTELVRQYRAQIQKDAMIIDERFNDGGQIPDRFIELLNRPALAFWSVRDGKDWAWPPVAQFGPKVMLINGWSGSGGDAFPYYFREAKLGPLVGTRTWGGLIGISGSPSLVDGGVVTVPTFRMYGPDGQWFPEGHGVTPDIEVIDDPTTMAKGKDPQLEKAVDEALRLLESSPGLPTRPSYENRTAGASQSASN